MVSIEFSTPAMYADHHVLAARAALLDIEGVASVYASSAWQTVIVSYDPEKTSESTLEAALSDAGYGSMVKAPVLAKSDGPHFKDPAWASSAPRVTQTNELDREMSVDFKR
jgi:copper chaperone CopZ